MRTHTGREQEVGHARVFPHAHALTCMMPSCKLLPLPMDWNGPDPDTPAGPAMCEDTICMLGGMASMVLLLSGLCPGWRLPLVWMLPLDGAGWPAYSGAAGGCRMMELDWASYSMLPGMGGAAYAIGLNAFVSTCVLNIVHQRYACAREQLS
eukprot:scaffold102908_cov20-Tisochrysis_lutea.AAC.1